MVANEGKNGFRVTESPHICPHNPQERNERRAAESDDSKKPSAAFTRAQVFHATTASSPALSAPPLTKSLHSTPDKSLDSYIRKFLLNETSDAEKKGDAELDAAMKDVVADLVQKNGCLRVGAASNHNAKEAREGKDEANMQRRHLMGTSLAAAGKLAPPPTSESSRVATSADEEEAEEEEEFESAEKQLKDLESQLRENARKRRDIDNQLKGYGKLRNK